MKTILLVDSDHFQRKTARKKQKFSTNSLFLTKNSLFGLLLMVSCPSLDVDATLPSLWVLVFGDSRIRFADGDDISGDGDFCKHFENSSKNWMEKVRFPRKKIDRFFIFFQKLMEKEEAYRSVVSLCEQWSSLLHLYGHQRLDLEKKSLKSMETLEKIEESDKITENGHFFTALYKKSEHSRLFWEEFVLKCRKYN